MEVVLLDREVNDAEVIEAEIAREHAARDVIEPALTKRADGGGAEHDVDGVGR